MSSGSGLRSVNVARRRSRRRRADAVAARPRDAPTPLVLFVGELALADLHEVGTGADADEHAVVDDGHVLDALAEHGLQHRDRQVAGADTDEVATGVLEERFAVVSLL